MRWKIRINCITGSVSRYIGCKCFVITIDVCRPPQIIYFYIFTEQADKQNVLSVEGIKNLKHKRKTWSINNEILKITPSV